MACILLQFFGPMTKVETIGKTFAPEFGSLAVIVAAITMAGIVFAHRMTSCKNI